MSANRWNLPMVTWRLPWKTCATMQVGPIRFRAEPRLSMAPTFPILELNLLALLVRFYRWLECFIGVCANNAKIKPKFQWNLPLYFAVCRTASAIAAGCTLVIKPAEQTPLSTLHLCSLIVKVIIITIFIYAFQKYLLIGLYTTWSGQRGSGLRTHCRSRIGPTSWCG